MNKKDGLTDSEYLGDPECRGGNADALFEPACFLSELALPPGESSQLRDAAKAIRQEYRDCSKWKRLSCHKVSLFAERDRGTLCVVHVGPSVEFDWTWEGAKAFRPCSIDDDVRFSDRSYEESDYEEGNLWSGEIVEVDERNGCLFISLDHPENMPSTGAFFVSPFDFLSVLEAVYNSAEFDKIREGMPSRLNASAGEVYPSINPPKRRGLPDLQDWWNHSWSVLWGPPGSGKTYTVGQQIASVLEDEQERILVVSTTNRATDAVALSIGAATSKHCPGELDNDALMRIGKGASYQTFVDHELTSMLRGTESSVLVQIDQLAQQLQLFDSWEEKALTRKKIGELRSAGNDQSHRIFIDPDKRVVVSTAFKAMSYLKDHTIKKRIEEGKAPFTTIFIDEAGLMSRTAIAALSLLAARRVVLVGDSKQLAPISRISRILPTRQQTWLASSGLSHLEEIDATPQAVHVLSQQRRMHPEVCKVVSEFQYDGFLTTAADRIAQESSLSPFLAKFSRAIWYVLDEEDCDLDSIRATRGPGNKSWIREITPAILKKLFLDEKLKSSTGMFISPYKAQAVAVSGLFAQWGIASWEASTVHSQQGTEADVVIFDTVNAGSCNWPFEEWKRLINVALSRAREAVIVLASRSEMEEPYLKPLLSSLKPGVLIVDGGSPVWRNSMCLANHSAKKDLGGRAKVVSRQLANGASVAEGKTEYRSIGQTKDKMGDQFAKRRKMKPILSRDQQRLTNLQLDGKPRLVRGVAGSGKSVVLCNWLAKTTRRLIDDKEARIWAVYANRSLHKLLRESIESAWEDMKEGDLFSESEFPWERVSLLHVKEVLTGILVGAEMSMDSYGFEYDKAAEAFLNRENASELLPRCSALFVDEAQDMGPSTLRLLLSLVEQTDQEDANSRAAHLFYDNAQNVYGTKTPKWSDFGLDMRGRSTIMRESFRSTTPITEFAVNVLDRLSGSSDLFDKQECISLGIIEPTIRNGKDWLQVRFSQVHGPDPIYHTYEDRHAEIDGIAKHLRYLIQEDNISPQDICLIYNGKARQILETRLKPRLDQIGVELSVQTNRSFERRSNTLIATTPQSYKGYESEVVLIPCVDDFLASEGKILSSSLYVAMTRARSLLAIYGLQGGSTAACRLSSTLADCIKALSPPP